MTPTLRHARRAALYQRRQLLRHLRREQQPIPGWFGGQGAITYRGGLRPLPRPQRSLASLIWQGTQAGGRQILRIGKECLWAGRYVGGAAALLAIAGLGIYGLVLLWPHLPSLPTRPPVASRPPHPSIGMPLDDFMVQLYNVTNNVYLPLLSAVCVMLGAFNMFFRFRLGSPLGRLLAVIGVLGLGIIFMAQTVGSLAALNALAP